MTEADILFFILAFLSEIIGTIAGFGSSTIFLPLALFFFDFKTAIILIAVFHAFGNIGRITFFKHGVDIKLLIRFGVPSILLSIAGAFLIGMLPQPLLKFIMGIFLVGFSVSSLLKPQLKFPASNSTLVLGGAFSGFLTGLIGTGGALRAAFLTGFNLNRFTYIATAASIALATDATRIPIYLSEGFLAEQYYFYIPVLFAMAIAGSFVGRKIVGRIDQKLFRKIVLIAIMLVSSKFIIDGLALV